MGWADEHIQKLQNNEVVKFRPTGGSMSPLINSGQLVTVAPCFTLTVRIDDIVLCEVNGKQFLHKVHLIRDRDEGEKIPKYLIVNNKGGINGWTPKTNVYGIVLHVED